MTKTLSEAQRTALADYAALAAARPQLFRERAIRRLVLDPDALSAWALEHDIVLGVAAATSHLYLLVDLVESTGPEGEPFRYPYLRVVAKRQLSGGFNVVLLAVIADPALGRVGDIVLVEQERHATGRRELELPRGFGTPGLGMRENALKELREETGYLGEAATVLGTTLTDSGLLDAEVHFLEVPVTGRGDRAADPREAICGIRLMSAEAIWDAIRRGEIRDGFTVQGMALLGRARGG